MLDFSRYMDCLELDSKSQYVNPDSKSEYADPLLRKPPCLKRSGQLSVL